MQFKDLFRKYHRKGAETGTEARTEAREADRKAQAFKEKSKKDLTIASFVWTIISVAVAIGSAVYAIAKNWVNGTLSYVLIGFIAAFSVLLVVFICLCAGDYQKGKKSLKALKFSISIFRSAITIVYLIVTAITMAGVASSDIESIGKWFLFVATLTVAVVKLALVVAKFVAPKVVKYKFAHNDYRMFSYVNGKLSAKRYGKTNKLLAKITEWSRPILIKAVSDPEPVSKGKNENIVENTNISDKTPSGETADNSAGAIKRRRIGKL